MSRIKKSNKSLVIVALLLVSLVAITSLFTGRTLAKYITAAKTDETAHVARFGINVSEEVDLFKASYKNDSGESTVSSTDGIKKVIAPGTEGSYSFEVAGTSEVAFVADADFDIIYTGWSNDYKPIQFRLDGGTWGDAAALKLQLDALFEDTEVIAPGAEYSQEATIEWQWPFEGADDLDTAHGMAETAPTINVVINVKAEQVD